MDLGYDFSIFRIPKLAEKPLVHSCITSPFRKIDSVSMIDDFYSNLIDWSGEYIFFAVDSSIYFYNFFTETREKIFQSDMNTICSLKCLKQLNLLAIGSSSGIVTYIDLTTLKSSKHLYHRGRISCFATCENKIITGSRDRKSKVIDIRTKMPISTYLFHTQEVCGVSINADQKHLATGGNDNKIFVVDVRNDSTPFIKIEDHKAAVKALSWSPKNSSYFVSGGGTADKTMKVWDINASTPLQRSLNYDSQICNVKWLNNNKILSTFGYSNDDIKLLKNFKIEKRFIGHKNRVIHFAVNDDQSLFVSGSGDSSIKIWEIDNILDLNDIHIR